MKYYGFFYGGESGKYDTKNAAAYDSPYQALGAVSQEWSNGEDPSDRRLLVVLSKPDSENTGAESTQYAFFQFTDAKACMDFIKRQEEIQWLASSAPVKGCWNGDAQMMG